MINEIERKKKKVKRLGVKQLNEIGTYVYYLFVAVLIKHHKL